MNTSRRGLIRAGQWLLRFGAMPLLGSIPALRGASGASDKRVRVPEGIERREANAGGVRCEWLAPASSPSSAAVLYLHGGGGVLGLYNSCRKLAGHIALTSSLRVLCVDYRLAPEHPFPAGLYDCLAAYRWLLSQGFQPARIAIAGDSMGGLLTLTAALALRDSHEPLPAALVCLSPNTDGTVSGRSMHANAWRDALLSPQFARRTMSLFAGKRDRRDPCLSPLHAELHELPPILLQAGADEILLDDSRCFAERALAAGAAVTLQIWPGMWHDWQLSVPELPEAKEAIRCVSEFLHKHLVTAVERG